MEQEPRNTSKKVGLNKKIFSWVFQVLLIILAAFFIREAVSEMNSRTQEFDWPSLQMIGLCFFICVLGQYCLAQAWIAMFPEHSDHASQLARSVHLSQISKYIPGGVPQLAAQIGVSKIAGISFSKALRYLLIFNVIVVIAGMLWGVPYIIWASKSAWYLRVVSLSVLLVLPLTRKSFLMFVSDKIESRFNKKIGLESLTQSVMNRLLLWLLVFMGLHGVAFSIILSELTANYNFGYMFVYGPAFAIGLLAVPFPAGMLIRELVLITALGWILSEVVIVAAVMHRLIALCSEIVVLASNLLFSKFVSSPELNISHSFSTKSSE